jgi:hypothetical protein
MANMQPLAAEPAVQPVEAVAHMLAGAEQRDSLALLHGKV